MPPESSIIEVSPFGEIKISLSTLTSLFGDVDTATARRRGRRLQSYDNNGIDIDLQNFMSFEYIRGQDAADADKLRFEPYLQAFGGTEMVIKFDFENPLEVSTGTTPDQIITKFTDPRLLYDSETGMFIQNPGMVSELPRMLMSDEATDVLIASCNIVASATNTALVLFILVGLSLTAMTKSIWHFINVVQVIAYLKYFVEWPANAAQGLQCLDYSVSGRLQTDFLWNIIELFRDNVDTTKTVYGEVVDTTNVFKAVGIYPLILVILLLTMVYAACLRMWRNKNISVRRQYLNLNRKIYYGAILRFMIEIDLKLVH